MLTEIEAGPRERIPRPSPKTELLTVTLAAVNDIEGSMEDDAGSNSSRRASIEAKEADESPPHSSFTDLSLTDDDSGSTITNLGSGSSIRRVRLPTGNLREIDSPYVVAGSSPVVTTNESTNDVPSPLPISKESDIVTSDEREPKRQVVIVVTSRRTFIRFLSRCPRQRRDRNRIVRELYIRKFS